MPTATLNYTIRSGAFVGSEFARFIHNNKHCGRCGDISFCWFVLCQLFFLCCTCTSKVERRIGDGEVVGDLGPLDLPRLFGTKNKKTPTSKAKT